MKYELLKESCVGIVIDSMPILHDIKDTFEVSFILPEEGNYIALFCGEDNDEYKSVIKNNVARVPKELLSKDQRIELTVCRLREDVIVQSWKCHLLRVGSFLQMRQTQRQLAIESESQELLQCYSEIARSNANLVCAFEELKNTNGQQQSEIAKWRGEFEQMLALQTQSCRMIEERTRLLHEQIEHITDKYNAAVESFNTAVATVNNLSERLAALEANYDPTIIK